MAIPSQEIGYGTEEKLLWQISKQLESLTGATYNSKKTLLNVASGENAGAKIETFSGAWIGLQDSSPFLTVDLSQSSGGIIEYSMIADITNPIFGNCTGTLWFGGNSGIFEKNQQSESNKSNTSVNNIQTSITGQLVSFSFGTDTDVTQLQVLYTVKLFTLPSYTP
jgi:hypothetical protein